jgi:hypothetical protein
MTKVLGMIEIFLFCDFEEESQRTHSRGPSSKPRSGSGIILSNTMRERCRMGVENPSDTPDISLRITTGSIVFNSTFEVALNSLRFAHEGHFLTSQFILYIFWAQAEGWLP